MSVRVVDKCYANIVPIIEKMGYDVVEVEYAKKVDGMNLTFYIDKECGITLEDCENVSNAISDLLDEINVTDDVPYLLNVSSPGLDRPIKNEKDFKRNKDKDVEIKLYAPLNGQKSFIGSLCNLTDSEYIIKTKNGEIMAFNKDKVAICLPVIKF